MGNPGHHVRPCPFVSVPLLLILQNGSLHAVERLADLFKFRFALIIDLLLQVAALNPVCSGKQLFHRLHDQPGELSGKKRGQKQNDRNRSNPDQKKQGQKNAEKPPGPDGHISLLREPLSSGSLQLTLYRIFKNNQREHDDQKQRKQRRKQNHHVGTKHPLLQWHDFCFFLSLL